MIHGGGVPDKTRRTLRNDEWNLSSLRELNGKRERVSVNIVISLVANCFM